MRKTKQQEIDELKAQIKNMHSSYSFNEMKNNLEKELSKYKQENNTLQYTAWEARAYRRVVEFLLCDTQPNYLPEWL